MDIAPTPGIFEEISYNSRTDASIQSLQGAKAGYSRGIRPRPTIRNDYSKHFMFLARAGRLTDRPVNRSIVPACSRARRAADVSLLASPERNTEQHASLASVTIRGRCNHCRGRTRL